MSQTPPRIFTSREDLVAIEQRIVLLDDEARVRVTLDDGTVVRGTVSARPTLEIFRNSDGDEGHNARLRLDDLEHPDIPHYIWVGDVRDIEGIGTA
ncbi:DUF3247 family protein [Luteimonas sp. 3794]|uniref:DUF3247 family protein n=1 Tax=Luteimonas sp. 3794 TaxID=2817730 RepID=UPI002861B06C|nr:DUF3247 family protein [Luteimonas sp. 3794]MDR6991010.1 hypothetical protein [Luteimonas sp. 3794]